MEHRIAFHARLLGIAYRVCLYGGIFLLAVCGWVQWDIAS